MEKKVSIIVPIYNSENTIERCVNSLISQTLKEIEIILVNDGSNDNSLELINNFAQKDTRIKVLDKNNKGVSSARNHGINNSEGKYIMFVDSDDYLEEDICKKSYEFAEKNKLDFVSMGFVVEDENGKIINKEVSKEKLISDNNISIGNILCNMKLSYVWGRLYKYELISDIEFDEELNYSEDSLFIFETCFKLNSIGILNEIGYHFIRQNKTTLSKKYVENIGLALKKTYTAQKELCNKYNEYNIKVNGIGLDINVAIIYRSILNNYQELSPLKYKDRIKFIRKYMDDVKINNLVNKECKPKNKLDKLFLILYKLKNPYIMDFVFYGKKRFVSVLNLSRN